MERKVENIVLQGVSYNSCGMEPECDKAKRERKSTNTDQRYSHPPPYEPPVILSTDLGLQLPHFIHSLHCIVSTVEKIGMSIAAHLLEICGFY